MAETVTTSQSVFFLLYPKRQEERALTAVAQSVGHHPTNWKVVGSICGQGTCLVCGLSPGHGMFEKQPIIVSLSHPCFSPSFPPFPPKSISISLGENFKRWGGGDNSKSTSAACGSWRIVKGKIHWHSREQLYSRFCYHFILPLEGISVLTALILYL